MNEIKDYAYYTELMRNGFYDKLFFIDKIFDPWDSLVDYGCGEGFLTKLVGKIFRDKMIYGYDIDSQMINAANWNGESLSNVHFFADEVPHADIIYLSSVIHEVYHYKKISHADFWKMVFCPARKYVVIRDMFYSEAEDYPSVKQVDAVKRFAQQNQILHILQQFEKEYQPISTVRGMTHWLLKYLYMSGPNYERELHENYLPMSWEAVRNIIPEGWTVQYYSISQIAWLANQWEKHFGMKMPFHTHGKFIIKNETQI